MNPLVVWSIALMALGLLLVLLEVFLPSGGILGFLCVASLVSSISLAFYHSLQTGFAFLAVAALAVPTVLFVAFQWWPYTPMGKRLLLDVHSAEEMMPDTPLRRTLRQLVGKVGVAKTVMLPSGAVMVEGMTVDALSEGMPIEAGQRVVVVEVRGSEVVVRPYEDDGRAISAKADDILSQPIESGLDPFDDPLA